MPDFLLEIGVEELPSSFVRAGLRSLEAAAGQLLAQHRLEAEVAVLGTARRLALQLRGLPAAQPAREETVQGPPWAAAFKDGQPTRAALGFAQKYGVEVEALTKVETPKGDYVSVHVREEGRPTAEVLAAILGDLCARITFPKSMRWGAGEFSFGRPIHWIVALLDDAVVPFRFADVAAGRLTRGHRFLAPESFPLPHANAYVDALDKAHVLVVTDQRRARMLQLLEEAASDLGGVLPPDDFLVDECVSLVEEPFVVPGSFEPEFLELPDEVVVSVMRDHQRYFAVRSAQGALLPRYLNVVNTAVDPETIAKGNDRVLRARLKDAQFFVAEDTKVIEASGFRVWRAKLDSVVFQRKLGTVGAKVERIRALAREFAPFVGVDPSAAAEAADLCKVDLESLIVFEFPELQGKMGRFYAERAGVAPEIAAAIEEHYQPAGAQDEVAPSALGALVGVADRIDTLVGCFLIGQQPKGNADPFGLRRAALGVVRTAFEGAIDVDLEGWIEVAARTYGPLAEGKDDALADLREFFDARLRVWLKDRYPRDLVDACISAWRTEAGGHSLRDLRDRIEALERLRDTEHYAPLAVAFKRAHNITKDVAARTVDPSLLTEPAEQELGRIFAEVRPLVDARTEAGDYAGALQLVAERLKGPIDTFFDQVFVMVDDPAVRDNRLALLKGIADCVSRIVHFHRLQV